MWRNIQVFILGIWRWYKRSDTRSDCPPLNKPQDAVHSNSHAAPTSARCLRFCPRTQLFVDWLEEASSWGGGGAHADQRWGSVLWWWHVGQIPGRPPLTPPTGYLVEERQRWSKWSFSNWIFSLIASPTILEKHMSPPSGQNSNNR